MKWGRVNDNDDYGILFDYKRIPCKNTFDHQ